jgi:hypothetical protein
MLRTGVNVIVLISRLSELDGSSRPNQDEPSREQPGPVVKAVVYSLCIEILLDTLRIWEDGRDFNILPREDIYVAQ